MTSRSPTPPQHSADDARQQPYTGTALLIGSSKQLGLLAQQLRVLRVDAVVVAMSRSSDIEQHLGSGHVQMVIVNAGSRANRLFTALRTLAAPPILVALIGGANQDTPVPADLIMPANSPRLAESLTNLLALQRRAAASPTPASSPSPTNDSDLLKTMIVKTVSHELRTPLLQVKSAVALLAEDSADRERLLAYAAESISRLEHVVANITRLAESLEISPEPVFPSEIVAHTLKLLRRSWDWRDKADRVIVQAAPDVTPISCDRQAISVALQLLLDNALKFSSETVRFLVQPNGIGGMDFVVADNGIGIPPNFRDRIFEPFFQVDQAIARRYGGSGVGLAIVRLILDRHRVKINIDSTPGQGSTFSFALPLLDGALPSDTGV